MKIFKKILILPIVVYMIFGFNSPVCAQDENPTVIQLENQAGNTLDENYQPLAPLPGLEDFNAGEECAFGKYLNTLIKLIIAILGVLAVVMIVLGGMQYMTSELISSKEAGKERIINAFLGLIIALSSYLILNTINPDLLNLCLNVPGAKPVGEELDTTIDGEGNNQSGGNGPTGGAGGNW